MYMLTCLHDTTFDLAKSLVKLLRKIVINVKERLNSIAITLSQRLCLLIFVSIMYAMMYLCLTIIEFVTMYCRINAIIVNIYFTFVWHLIKIVFLVLLCTILICFATLHLTPILS